MKYRVTGITPGVKHKAHYVSEDKIDAAAEKIFGEYPEGDPRRVRFVEVAERAEYFNNGSWHTTYRPIKTVEKQGGE